ncbi:MAG: hypothetical protein IT285_16050 [Bdellovibrionales bacterium]|nr:hypothetical protein [Bdellovibrionales bacterium]
MRPNWTEYLVAGLAAVLLSWVTGCRFGNHSSQTIKRTHSLPTYAFASELSEVRFCAFLEGVENPQCGSTGTESAPAWATDLIPGVVAIQMDGEGSTSGALFNPLSTEAFGLSTTFSPVTGALAHEASFEPQAFWWADGTCMNTFTLWQDGQATNAGAPESVSGVKVSGRLGLAFTGINDYSGAGCAQAFEQIELCHADAEQCGETEPENNQVLHEALVEMFAPYLAAGAVTPAQLGEVRAIGYEVSFE